MYLNVYLSDNTINESMNLFLKAVNFTLCKARRWLQTHVPDTILSGYAGDLCLRIDDPLNHHKSLIILLEEVQQDGWTLQPKIANSSSTLFCFLGVHKFSQGLEVDTDILQKIDELPVS